MYPTGTGTNCVLQGWQTMDNAENPALHEASSKGAAPQQKGRIPIKAQGIELP